MTPGLAIGTIVATFAYLGLAVLGAGGFAYFLSHPPLIALAIALFVLSGVVLFSGGNLSPGEREDRANRWVILVFAVIGLLSAYLPAYTDRKQFWTIDGDSFAGLASFSSPPVVHCGSGPSLYSAGGSVDWSPSSPDIRSLRLESIGLSATPAIWGCSSTRWGGPSHFVRGWACCSRRSSSRRFSRAYKRKRRCCARSSAARTIPTASERHGSFLVSIDERPKLRHRSNAGVNRGYDAARMGWRR
jgi:hypothetical protein